MYFHVAGVCVSNSGASLRTRGDLSAALTAHCLTTNKLGHDLQLSGVESAGDLKNLATGMEEE